MPLLTCEIQHHVDCMAKEELVGRRFKQCGAFFFGLLLLFCYVLHFILFMPNGPICKINNTVVVVQALVVSNKFLELWALTLLL
jgi:hypothetical protein